MNVAGDERRARYLAARRDATVAVLEGFHAAKHARRFGADILDAVSPDRAALSKLGSELAPDLVEWIEASVVEIPAEHFRELAPEPPHTGIVAIAARPPATFADALGGAGAPIVLLEEPVHLGNLGAAVRVAAAAGAAGVFNTGAHDPWHPAAVRAAAGLQFALPVARIGGLPADLDRPVLGLHLDGEPLEIGSIPDRALIAFGSERRGLGEELAARADRLVRIPMRGGIASLNLATAVAIVLYGWRLGRRMRNSAAASRVSPGRDPGDQAPR